MSKIFRFALIAVVSLIAIVLIGIATYFLLNLNIRPSQANPESSGSSDTGADEDAKTDVAEPTAEEMQLAQRDAARKNNVGQTLSALVSYQANNRGSLPTDDYIEAGGLYDDGYLEEELKIVAAPSDLIDVYVFQREIQCSGVVASPRDFSVKTKLESGTTYCRDN